MSEVSTDQKEYDRRIIDLKKIIADRDTYYPVKIFFLDFLLWLVAYIPMGMIYSLIRNGDPFRHIGISYVNEDAVIDAISFALIGAVLLLLYKLYLTKKMRAEGYSIKILLKPTSFTSLSLGITSAINKIASMDPKEVYQINKVSTIEDLDRRTRSISRKNGYIIFLIAWLLLSTVVIVVFAGKLTSLDVSAVSTIDRIKTEIKEADDRISTTSKNLFDTQRDQFRSSEIARLTKVLEEKPSIEIVNELTKIVRDLNNDEYGSSRYASRVPNAIYSQEAAQIQKEQAIEQSKSFRKKLDEALQNQIKPDDQSIDWRYIIATGVTRVGVIVIIVFLVQILLSLYRYNTRLSTYYNSIKDVIRLYDGNVQDLQTLILSFAPPKVAFDKDPKHPLEDIIRIVSQKIKDDETKGAQVSAQGAGGAKGSPSG